LTATVKVGGLDPIMSKAVLIRREWKDFFRAPLQKSHG
jgi:hypothetical protein